MSRRLSRPRTKLYDSNYTMGEAYYKSALDDLDRKSGIRRSPSVQEPAPEPPQYQRGRPSSVADVDAMMKEAAAKAAAAATEEDDALSETLKRIRMARAATITAPEESFESAFNSRREEVKRRFSEKMLDTVGINGSASQEESVGSIVAKRRAAKMIREAEEEVGAPAKWTALTALAVNDDADIRAAGAAAEARAVKTRARLADLEREMEDIEARSSARDRRLAALRALRAEEDISSSSTSSQMAKMSSSLSAKKMTLTTTTTTSSY